MIRPTFLRKVPDWGFILFLAAILASLAISAWLIGNGLGYLVSGAV